MQQATLAGFAAQGVDAQGARDHIRNAVALAADARLQFLREQEQQNGAAEPRARPLIGCA